MLSKTAQLERLKILKLSLPFPSFKITLIAAN